MLQGIQAEINRIQPIRYFGQIKTILGLVIRVEGLNKHVTIGSRCRIHKVDGSTLNAEIVSFVDKDCIVMPFSPISGLGIGCRVEVISRNLCVHPCDAWLGRAINGEADPVDKLGPLSLGTQSYPVRCQPLPSADRAKVGDRLDMGVKAINTFTTLCRGQRMGIFAGSGVGKSVLMSQMARFSKAQVNVIGLIGERGREVNEFIYKILG